MRVLITGSSGMIGTNLAEKLCSEGHFVFGVDWRLNPWTQAFPYLLQDLGAPRGIDTSAWPRPLDVVVHLAAHAKVHDLVKDPARALENIVIAFNVLEFCRKEGLPLIFSSSREVYGDIHRYITDEAQADFAFTESTYSASKISAEALIYSYARCYGLKYLVFRFSNVYGRYDCDLDRMERVVPLFIGRIWRGEEITIYGREKTLDFTYIDDCVGGIAAGIQRLASGAVANQTINLAYGEGNTLARLAEFIGEAVGKPPRMQFAPSRLGEVTHYVADISRARELLGYSPQVNLAEGVRRAVEWQRGRRASVL